MAEKVPPIVVRVTGEDQATKVIKDVAGQVKDLQSRYGEVTIDAEADARQAQKVLEGLKETVEALDKTDPKVKVLADTVDALSDVRSVQELIERLERAAVEVEVTADTGKAEADLKDVKGQAEDLSKVDAEIKVTVDEKVVTDSLDRTRKRAGDSGGEAGKNFGATFVRDLGAPIGGGVENVIGDIAEAFNTAGETIGGVFGERAGRAISAIGTTAAVAFGVGGIAFLAVQGFFDLFNRRANEAKKRLEEVGAVQTLLATGNQVEAVKKLFDVYGDAINNAEKLGLAQDATTKFILGGSTALGRYSADLDITGDDLADITTLQQKYSDLSYEQAQATADLLQPLFKARQEYAASGKDLKSLQQQQFEVLKGVDASTKSYLEFAKTALPEVRDQVLDYVAATEEIPPEVLTTIKADADPDDIAQVEKLLDKTAEERTAEFIGIAFAATAGRALDDTAKKRIAEILAEPNTRAADGALTATARTRIADVVAQALYGKAEADLSRVERDRVTAVVAQAFTADAERDIWRLTQPRTVPIRFQASGAPVFGMANGGVARFAEGGVALVGERGPELVGLPDGANVQPSERIRNWLYDAIAAAVRANGPAINIDARGLSPERTGQRVTNELRRYARLNGQIFSGGSL